MVPIRGPWTSFVDTDDQISHYRAWGLIPSKSTKLRPVMVIDGYFDTPEPCKVVGYQGDYSAVIELPDGFHAIFGEHLAEIQPIAHQKLPFGVCFAEILSKYVVLDVETTGADLHNDRIIRISSAIYEYGKKVDEYNSFVNPGKLLPTSIIDLTGISQSDVDSAPSIEGVSAVFRDFIGDLPVIGHCISSFGMPFIVSQIPFSVTNPIIDTMPMVRKVFDLLPCYTLPYLRATLQLPDLIANNPLANVETTNSILWACMNPRRYESLVNKAFLDDRLASPEEKRKEHNWRLNHSTPRDVTIINQTNVTCSATIISSRKDSVSAQMRSQRATDSPADVPSKYVVFDIETTGFDSSKDRVIEIAAAIYEKGIKISEFSTFVNPGKSIPPTVVKLTGITQKDVSGAPTIMDVAPKFFDFIGDLTIIGHNIRTFDVPFLTTQTNKKINNPIIDTLPMSRVAFPQLSSYKLESLKKILRLPDGVSHRALADVETTNALLLACMSPQQFEPIENLAPSPDTPSPAMKSEKSASILARKRNHSSINIKEIVPSCNCTDLSSPLYGKIIVFTGELSISRSEAMQMAVDAGATLKTSVSRKTDYLVVGKQDITIVGMDGMSTKEEAAHALNQSGKTDIKIISEAEFLQLTQKEGASV